MPSSYSTNLKIELQATGENSGTWGTITNTNLGTALEQAIVGYGNPSYASDANLTLTYTDTNAAQAARALVLNVTSAVSLTNTRELVVPTIQKQYIVQNNTTGSQSITVKTSGGTGITVPNGRKAHLYVNGTDVIYMDDYVDINGGAIDGTPIGANSASTGAFTTLSASGNITVSGGTANGVLYLNGSKVATSGTALTFDGTSVTFGSTAQRIIADMSNATSTSRLLFQTSTTNGNSSVGVIPNGTSAVGQFICYNSADANNASTAQLIATSTVVRVQSGQTGTGSYIPLTFYTSGAEVARLDTSGNLGIGTSSPAYKLDVSGTARISNGGDTYVGFGANKDNYWTTGTTSGVQVWRNSAGSEFMRLDSSGNLGLGVTPSAWSIRALQVGNGFAAWSSGTTNARIFANTYYDGAYKYVGTGRATQYEQDGYHAWYTSASGTAGNAITFTQAMTLDASGNLGIGTSSPNQKLDVAGSVQIRDSGTHYLNNSDNSNQYYWQNIGATGANNATLILSRTNAGETLRVDSSGNLGLGVTPNSGWADFKVFQNTEAAILGYPGQTHYTQNAYWNGSVWKYIASSSTPASRYTHASGAHFWFIAGSGTAGNTISFTQAMTLDASGNLGVGTASPTSGFRVDLQATTARLRIESTTGTNPVETRTINTGGTLYAGIDSSGGSLTGSAYAAYYFYSGNYPLIFGTNNAERARITSGGNFFVGCTATPSATVEGFCATGTSSGNLTSSGSSTSAYNHWVFYNGNGLVGSISTSGSATAYNTSSDRRLKDNILPADDAGSVIDAIEIVKHDWKAGGNTRYGVIAQDLHAIAPEAVKIGDDNEEVSDPWGVDYSKLVPMLIKEVQSLRKRVAELEAK